MKSLKNTQTQTSSMTCWKGSSACHFWPSLPRKEQPLKQFSARWTEREEDRTREEHSMAVLKSPVIFPSAREQFGVSTLTPPLKLKKLKKKIYHPKILQISDNTVCRYNYGSLDRTVELNLVRNKKTNGKFKSGPEEQNLYSWWKNKCYM